MRDDAVRIVRTDDVDQPSRRVPPPMWVGFVVVLAGISAVLLLYPATEPETRESLTVEPIPEFAPSSLSLEAVLPPPEIAFGYVWSRVATIDQDSEINKVIAAGPGLVAVGSSNGNAAVWTSVDGAAWSRVLDGEAVVVSDRNQRMNGVTVGGPGLVAVGVEEPASGDSPSSPLDFKAAVWTSTDGTTWSRVGHDEAVFVASSLSTVVAGGPGLVAFGEHIDHGVVGVWTSVDGFAWSRAPIDGAVFGSATVESVIAGGPGLVAVGHAGSDEDVDAAVWTSAGGVAWSRVPHNESVFGGEDADAMFDVTAGGPGLVAVGEGAVVWTSVDGLVWSRLALSEATLGPNVRLKRPAIVSVASRGPDLVAVGESGWMAGARGDPVWTSRDGVTWSRFASQGLFDRDLNLVLEVGTGFLLLNEFGVWTAVPDKR